jgi:hypothetical protein
VLCGTAISSDECPLCANSGHSIALPPKAEIRKPPCAKVAPAAWRYSTAIRRALSRVSSLAAERLAELFLP